jgi:hypothetical protein
MTNAGLDHFALAWQIEPDLKELRVILQRRLLLEREHLGVHDAATGSHPLKIATTIARTVSERIRVVDNAERLVLGRDLSENAFRTVRGASDGLESAMWM